MSTVRKALLYAFAGRYFLLAGSIVSTMILARLLTPAETGLFAVAAGLVGVAQALRDFGIANYLIKEKELTSDLIGTALGMSLALGIALFSLFAIGRGIIGSFFAEPRLRSVILILSLNFMLLPVASVGTALLVRAMNFRGLMFISFVSTIVGNGTSIALAALGFGAAGLAWASVAGAVSGVVCNLVFHGHEFLVRPRFTHWRRLTNFGLFSSGASILSVVAERTPDMVIGRLIGFAAAGLYSRGNGVITLFEQALMGSVASVAKGALATSSRDGKNLRDPYLQSISQITVVAWPFLVLLGLLAHPMILILFGQQWKEAIPVARILCLAAALGIPGAVGFMLFSATGAARHAFRVQAATVIVHVLGVTAGALINLQMAACAIVASSLVSSLLTQRLIRKDIGVSWIQLLSAMKKSVVATAATAFIPALILMTGSFTGYNLWFTAIAGGLGGGIFWLGALYATGHPMHVEISLTAEKAWHRLSAMAG